MIGPLKKYRGIEAENLAAVMICKAKQNLKGSRIYESDQIQKAADNLSAWI